MKNHVEVRDIEEIINDLGYCFSSPEAEHFYEQILSRKYNKARKMLREYLEDEEIEKVINHFINESARKYTLKEITLEEFLTLYPFEKNKPSSDPESNNDHCNEVKVVINYRGNMINEILALGSFHTEWMFYYNNERVPLTKAAQIWLVENIKKK